MGNEASQLNGLEVEEKPVERTDFWNHYQATIRDCCRYFSLKSDGSVSVFKGEAVTGPLWAVSTPLEKFSNNLLKYRHPCIVRYISAWQQRSTLHLATEYVQPLTLVLKSQTPLQRCIGLDNILRALVFLHDQAGMSHNNVSLFSIYVTGDGQWKLGGLQYLCPFNELTSAYLRHARIHRYDKGVDPNEDTQNVLVKVDQFAFAMLVEDVYNGCNDDDVPHLREFKKYCLEILQHNEPAQRPSLAEVLNHSFFNHKFISIYKFLNFLPLKSEEEKAEFFSNILENLKCYDEETVAKQLSGLLLSRLTLLDQTARKEVLPHLFKPRNERIHSGENTGFFSLSIFKEHVKPKLMQLFGVRDAQVRMLLLTYFSKFVQVFTHEELSHQILPELLLGIKDTDDNLVAATLVCLSELVPILGADTVIGSKRSKLFTDGRPNSKPHYVTQNLSRSNGDATFYSPKPLSDFSCSQEILHDNSNSFDRMLLNERPSPVGGEAMSEEIRIFEDKTAVNKSDDDWSDWDNNKHQTHSDVQQMTNVPAVDINFSDSLLHEKPAERPETSSARTSLLQKAAFEAKKNMIDIADLDIKNQKLDLAKKGDDIDFFADMVPIIEKATVVHLVPQAQEFSNKLNFVPDEDIDLNDGWGDSWNE